MAGARLPTFLQYQCRHCEGEEITQDASCAWETGRCEYVLVGEYDQEYCQTCECETRTNEIVVTDPVEIAKLLQSYKQKWMEHHAEELFKALETIAKNSSAWGECVSLAQDALNLIEDRMPG